MIKRLLIANRGEIACRIMRTAQAQGIHCIAIYSDSDQNSLHVSLADEAWHVGPSPARESYLNSANIIAIAQQSAADAIHPGYGFLSENADFADACQQAGLIFIGPPAAAIRQMGSKNAAKALMQTANIPILAGLDLTHLSSQELGRCAQALTYPVLLKASAGGGGKGMRIVESADQFQAAFQRAQSEALKSFGDASLLVETYLLQPRHVEVQIFFDSFGNGIYLFDRDCSIQRRHQKIIEEAPAPFLDENLRKRMGETALQAARCIDYVGAGTIEFLLDSDNKFYFMEMNTRLQVEHPVSEMITGLDLVAWQIAVAEQKPLPLKQHELVQSGHSIEVRLYAENPANDFLPCTGTLHQWQIPTPSDSLRIDSGLAQGDVVSAYYDPLLAKVISHGATRHEAIQKLAYGLQQIHLSGLTSNLDYLKTLLQQEHFEAGPLSTNFLNQYPPDFLPSDTTINSAFMLAALAFLEELHDSWNKHSGWRLNQPAEYQVTLCYHSAKESLIKNLHISWIEYGLFRLSFDHLAYTVKTKKHETSDCLIATINDGPSLRVPFFRWDNNVTLHFGQHSLTLQQPSKQLDANKPVVLDSHAFNKAPMNGRIVEISCPLQHDLHSGQAILVMEAMKMELVIKANQPGKVSRFYCSANSVVSEGSILFDFEPAQGKPHT